MTQLPGNVSGCAARELVRGCRTQPKQLVGDGARAQSGFTRPHPLLRRVLAYLLLR